MLFQAPWLIIFLIFWHSADNKFNLFGDNMSLKSRRLVPTANWKIQLRMRSIGGACQFIDAYCWPIFATSR